MTMNQRIGAQQLHMIDAKRQPVWLGLGQFKMRRPNSRNVFFAALPGHTSINRWQIDILYAPYFFIFPL